MSSWVLAETGQFVMLDEPGIHAVITEVFPLDTGPGAPPFEIEFTRRGRATRLAYRHTLEDAMTTAELNARLEGLEPIDLSRRPPKSMRR